MVPVLKINSKKNNLKPRPVLTIKSQKYTEQSRVESIQGHVSDMEPFEFPVYFCFCRSYAGCKIKIAEIFYVFYTAPIYMVNRYLCLYIGTYGGALEPWRYWRRRGS